MGMTREVLKKHFALHHSPLGDPPVEPEEGDHRVDHENDEGIDVAHDHTPLGVILRGPI